jgi:aminopeptidase YwaD
MTPGVEVKASLRVARTVADLEAQEVAGEILLLLGDIAAEPLMPKAYPFYNPDAHKQLVALLERKAPAALVTATARHEGLAGGIYPFPMLEDGDFHIPSVYMTDVLGGQLAQLEGQTVLLTLRARREPSHACNVVARRGSGASGRLVVCAHIDTKPGTPGALDNAAGVAVLLLLARRLRGWQSETGIELVAFNGEDHYSAGGELRYLGDNEGRLHEVRLALNVDNAGYVRGPTAWSLYGVPDELAAELRETFSTDTGLVEGPFWPQSDHSVFAQRGVPAVAFTSLHFQQHPDELFSHTERDTPDQVDPARLEAIVDVLARLLQRLAARRLDRDHG